MGNLCSVSISTEATLSRCWDCVVGQASYTCKLEQNLKALSLELETLTARRDDVNQRVVFAQQQHMRCLNEVQLWLNRAGTMIAEVEELIQKGPQELQKLCLAGYLSVNYKSSYKFGRQVATKLEEIVPLKNDGVFEQVADQKEANLKTLTAALEDLKALRVGVNWKVDLAEQKGMKRLDLVEVWLSRSQTVISEAEQLVRDAEIEKLRQEGCFPMNFRSNYKFAPEIARQLEQIVTLKNQGVFEQVADQNKANFKALTDALEDLRALRDYVNWKVDLAEKQGMKRLNLVQVWLSRSETVISEAEQFVRDAYRDIEKLRQQGSTSTAMNCMTIYKFGSEVARQLEDIVTLKNQGVFDEVAKDERIVAADVRPAAPTIGLESTFIKVCSLLERKEVGMIGLHGLGGVGKTTLLTQVYNKLLSNNVPDCYDAIIWVVVSKDHTIENVQAKIGEELRFPMESWNHKSSNKKSQEIHRALSGKKFVLFLDDIWEHLDLIKVGVPLPSQENGSKVVFTTRLFDVCSQMRSNEKIEIKCLAEDEAWALFQQNVGEDTLNSHPDNRSFAKSVAAECRGLPLALIMIGRAMAGQKSDNSWHYAIKVLRDSAHSFAKEATKLFAVLKFSYDNLPSNTMRSCLLYCCLYPEDYSIEKTSLVEYWFCEGLLAKFQHISDARLEGHHIIDSLISASLLEEDGKHSVKMHDVIRDMTLWISCECEEEERFFVQAGLQLTTAPPVGSWEGARRVSFMKNQIECLTSTPKCPNLQTLFLNNNYNLCRNGLGFFRSMPKLRVLNLSACGALKELPRGISNLVSLECLDLSYTNIKELPMELERLTELKYLDLRWAGKAIIIPRQLISSFLKLQVFRLYSSIEHEDAVWIGGEDEQGLIEELASLQHLNEIWIEMKGASALQRLLSVDNLQRSIEALRLFNFSESEVFNVSYRLENMESLKYLSLYNCERVEEMKIEIGRERERERGKGRMLDLDSLESVELRNCRNLRDMRWLILAPNLRNLKVLNCAKMEEIIREGEVGNPFSKLQRLELESLPELKSIYPKALPFPFLTEVEIRSCPKLKKLPLDSDSAMGNNLTIQGDPMWWEEVEWEDEATRISHSFIPIPTDDYDSESD